MHLSNNDTVSWKQEIFSDNAVRSLFSKVSLLSNISGALYLALLQVTKLAITGEKGELRKSLIQLSFLLLSFVLFVLTYIFLIFPRHVLNLNLYNPAKS